MLFRSRSRDKRAPPAADRDPPEETVLSRGRLAGEAPSPGPPHPARRPQRSAATPARAGQTGQLEAILRSHAPPFQQPKRLANVPIKRKEFEKSGRALLLGVRRGAEARWVDAEPGEELELQGRSPVRAQSRAAVAVIAGSGRWHWPGRTARDREPRGPRIPPGSDAGDGKFNSQRQIGRAHV